MQPLTEETEERVCEGNTTFMECPFCLHDIAAAWQPLVSNTDELGRPRGQYASAIISAIPNRQGVSLGGQVSVTVLWLICQNTECRQVVMQVLRLEPPQTQGQGQRNETWIAVPKRSGLPTVDLLVPNQMREDYLEAWTILADSPRMSSVLSRRVLADLLKKYTGAKQFSLAQRIDAFVGDANHPSRLRENLHYLREIGDFSAHTQEAQSGTRQAEVAAAASDNQEALVTSDTRVINVTKEEAEWTLKIVADLFDYFIVAPEKDKKLRAAFDEKIKAAGRKPIK
jgi:Domain of unknown function (DUF4145)